MSVECFPEPTAEALVEQSLIAQAQAGDNEAFGVLFEAHRAELLRFAGSIVGSHDAEDVVQTVAEKTLAKVADFDGRSGPGSVRPWLYASTRNAAIDSERARTRMFRGIPCDPETLATRAEADPNQHETNPETTILQRATINKLLGKLSAQQANLIHALYIEGYTLKEYYEQTGIAPGTAKAHHSRAKKKLAALIARGEIDLS